MEIKPIRTQRDYKAALAEIERVFGAKPGTPDGDRLEVLATLVEAYEERHHPAPPPDPVDAIRKERHERFLGRNRTRGSDPGMASRE
jgi:HTH-type transcriptional regulator/antitoxin HigA